MAYNNTFPMSYQPSYYYPQYQQQQQMQAPPVSAPQPTLPATQNNGIIWVQGEAGAKSYLVAPNNTVQLWDSESQTIYLKSADASGMPSMKVLDYKIRNLEQPQVAAQQINVNESYVTQEELTGIKSELNRLKGELAKLTEVKDHAAEQHE